MSQKSTILIVVPNLDVGGTERQLSQILPSLANEERAITVATFLGKGALAPLLESRGIPVHDLSDGRIPSSGSGPFARLVWLALVSSRLWRMIGQVRPAIVHFFLPAAYLIGGIVAYLRGCRTLVMSRRSLNDYQLRHPWSAWMERRLHRRMTAVLGNSRSVIEQLLTEGVPADRVGLIHNGVDLALFDRAQSRSAARAALIIDETTFVMVIVANLIYYKGHSDLLRALHAIQGDLPDSWLLICLGRDQGIQASLEQEAEQLGLANRVCFVGGHPEVQDVVASADLGLLCSHEEGFPNAILEYMAAGLPVVTTNAGGAAEAVVAGETGIIVPVGDTAKLGKGILEITGNPLAARRMGAAGRHRVERTFSLDNCISEHGRLYDGLLQDPTRPVTAIVAGGEITAASGD